MISFFLGNICFSVVTGVGPAKALILYFGRWTGPIVLIKLKSVLSFGRLVNLPIPHAPAVQTRRYVNRVYPVLSRRN